MFATQISAHLGCSQLDLKRSTLTYVERKTSLGETERVNLTQSSLGRITSCTRGIKITENKYFILQNATYIIYIYIKTTMMNIFLSSTKHQKRSLLSFSRQRFSFLFYIFSVSTHKSRTSSSYAQLRLTSWKWILFTFWFWNWHTIPFSALLKNKPDHLLLMTFSDHKQKHRPFLA